MEYNQTVRQNPIEFEFCLAEIIHRFHQTMQWDNE